jgi:immune inhibitor A
MKIIIKLTAIILALFIFRAYAQAAPHITGKVFEGEPKDFVHKNPDIRELRAKNLSAAQIRSAIGSTGTKKIAVILCDFATVGSNTSSTSGAIANYANIQNTLSGMTSFYNEVSYGQLTLQFTTLPSTSSAYTASLSMSSYGSGSSEAGDQLIKEMIVKAGISQGTTAGKYDFVMVIHAGLGNESTSNSGDIWSALYSFSTPTNGFSEGIIAPEREIGTASPLGVCCHEFGHQLGLPDMYNTSTGGAMVGIWTLMDSGSWASNGANPSHPDAWCMQLLGWMTPVTPSGGTASLTAAEISNSCIRLSIPTAPDPAKEYFLLEYRSNTAALYDRGLPGSGVLIWHVDEGVIDGTTYAGRLSDNSLNNYSHKTLDIVCADSNHPGASSSGAATNAWPGVKTFFTAPDSNSYNGLISGINISNFSFASGKADLLMTRIAAESFVSIGKVINYPNPAGPAYPVSAQKPAGTMTTLAFTFSCPPSQLSLTIFDLAGDTVKSAPGSAIKFRGDTGGPTKDYEWVYEYNWDGKNDSGAAVADGVYFYRVKADDKIKVGKLAIVR